MIRANASTDWVGRVTSLNQWRRGGERAPHKPLLLLYALGRLQRTGSSRMAFAEAEGDLRRLLEEFGPPRSTSPGYPFHHLTTDGPWVVATPAGDGSPGPNLGDLRAGAIGELAADFAGALEQEARLFGSVVRAVLDANFAATMHQDILDATGIALESVELAEVPAACEAATLRTSASRLRWSLGLRPRRKPWVEGRPTADYVRHTGPRRASPIRVLYRREKRHVVSRLGDTESLLGP
jgi:hypothetical protein